MIETNEQLDIIHHACSTHDNMMIEAFAGCGKSSTLERVAAEFPSTPLLFLAFNKKIAVDAEKRMSKTAQVRTFNGLGHRIWASATGKKLSLDPKKTQNLVKEAINESSRGDQKLLWDEYFNICGAVNHAKTVGYIPHAHSFSRKSLVDRDDLGTGVDEELSETANRLVDSVLLRSIKQAYDGTIDFSDQIYMPALFGGTYPRFPLVMVDEYQDLNPLNHLMIKKLATARLIGVGDPHQNIYGFRGAAHSGMSDAVTSFSMTELPLSISFRCPEAIVRAAHWHVPNFRWSRPGGSCITRARQTLLDFDDGSVIICRNNAPLLSLAMRLLQSGRSINVVGSDIGPKVIGQMKRLGTDTTTRVELLSRIDSWLGEKIANGSKTAVDTADCMKVFAAAGDNLSQAITYAQHLFAQEGRITLVTGHKAKGLEWPTVYHLDGWLIGDSLQERNLKYVIQTRSSDRYFEIDSKRIEG